MGFSGLDKPGRLAKEVTDRAWEVMPQPSRQPRFLFLNYFDTHQPYEPPEGIQGRVPPAIDHPIIIESRTLPGVNPTGDWFAIIDDGAQK